MKENIGFILTFTAMMITVAILSGTLQGCASKGSQSDTTGKMTCVGFCELDVGNRSTTIETEHPDGTVVKEIKKETGLSQDMIELNKGLAK